MTSTQQNTITEMTEWLEERQPGQSPIVPDGPGHGCGHNLLGTAALAAASVLKAWLQHTGAAATVRYYG